MTWTKKAGAAQFDTNVDTKNNNKQWRTN